MASQERSFHAIPTVSSLPGPTYVCDGKEMVSFSSNNYLALAHDPRMIAAARVGLECYGVGNCESRLLGGDLGIYHALESMLARLKGKEEAMLFATGYLTNLGVLGALTRTNLIARAFGYRGKSREKYVFFSDESNHTSIREGIRLSGEPKVTYRHVDMNDLERQLKASDATCKIIVSDGVFSMDGDIAPLPDLIRLAEEYDAAIYIDDAHGTGVLGKNGGGTTEHFAINSTRLISMGTLSKAYGAIGGFIACESYLASVLRNTCSAYGFTSTLPPDQVYAVRKAMEIVHSEPERHQRLWSNQHYFVKRMEEAGFQLLSKETCIVPVLIGDEELCEHLAHILELRGFHVDSVIFPAVKIGQSRLRFSVNAHHTTEQIDRLMEVLIAQQRLGWHGRSPAVAGWAGGSAYRKKGSNAPSPVPIA